MWSYVYWILVFVFSNRSSAFFKEEMGCSFPSLINGKWLRARLSAWMCTVDKRSSFHPPPSLLTHGKSAQHHLGTLAALQSETDRHSRRPERRVELKADLGGQESQPATNRHPVQGEGGVGVGLELCNLCGSLQHQCTVCHERTGTRTSWLACLWLKKVKSCVQTVAWKRLTIKTQSSREPFC